MRNQYNIPVFVPHFECPNDDISCMKSKDCGQTKMITKEDIKSTIERYLKNFKDENGYKEVTFFGENFTEAKKDLQEEWLQIVSEYVKSKKIDGISISTRPDYINKENLKMFKKYGVKTIELDVQSSNNYILKKSGREYTFEDVKKASKLIRWHRFNLGHQMVIGLQDSTRIDDLNTAKDLIKLKPKMVRIYPVLVMKNTKLESEYKNGEYEPITLNQAVERCKEIVYLFNRKKIDVIKIGAQNTDIIANHEQSQVIAGPYHPAFSQLVEDSIWYDSIVEKIKRINAKVKQVKVIVNPQDINNVIGYESSNLEKLKDLYNVEVLVEADPNIKLGKSQIEILSIYED